MRRLTERSDWDERYQAGNTSRDSKRGLLPKNLFGSYAEMKFWSLIKENLAPDLGQSVLEIGCAPGRNLQEFATRFGCAPFGVEFSGPGVDRTRENFQQWGYSSDHVIHADVFDPTFQTSVRGKFDAVVSRGFIEHFTDMPSVIDAHLGPLRPGGLLIITIPNYQGLNYAIGCGTVRESYPLHNFKIMNLTIFRSIFDMPKLRSLRCGFLGGFDFGIFDTGADTLVLKSYRRMQALLNLAFRIVPPPQFAWTSPNLIFIGEKCIG